EGKRRRMQAEEGLGELKKYVDSYLVISNDRLRDIFGNLTMTAAFAKADDILTTAAKGIAEIITIPGYVNVDFKDVRTVMNDSGVAIMGNAVAEGEQRALRAVEGALASPLLKDNEIQGARYILLNITSGKQEVTMDEVTVITDYIQEKAGLSADLIWGNCINESFENELSVTIIATGFQTSEERVKEKENERIEIPLTPDEPQTPFVKPINRFVQPETTARVNEPAAKPNVVERPVQQMAPQQVDLFNNPMSKPQLRNDTPESDGIIRHTLAPQEQPKDENVEEDGYEVKTAPSAFHFDLPSAADESVSKVEEPASHQHLSEAETSTPLSGAAASTSSPYKADEHKTPDYVEKELLKTKERILRLKELSMKLKSANGLQELETEPAYRRKQMALDDSPHTSESQDSRLTLSTDEGITEIRPNNSFLHDNVD